MAQKVIKRCNELLKIIKESIRLRSSIDLETQLTTKCSYACGKLNREDDDSHQENDDDENDDEVFAMDDFECEEMQPSMPNLDESNSIAVWFNSGKIN